MTMTMTKVFFLLLFVSRPILGGPASGDLKDISDLGKAISLGQFANSLDSLRERMKKEPLLSKFYCKHLGDLNINELYHLDSLLEHDVTSPQACKTKLRLALENYDQQSREEFVQVMEEPSKYRPIKIPLVDLVSPATDKGGESIEKLIDATKGPELFTADLPEGYLALTFDDGPNPKNTKKILDILAKANVRATFFGVGNNIIRYPQLVARARDEGHSFGTHSFDHSNLPKLSFKKASKNITKGRQTIVETLGFDMPFFRFPYGNRNRKLKKYVKDEKLASFLWNIDSLDWKIKEPLKLYKHTVDLINKEKRGIVLFHDIHSQTATIMPNLLENLADAGYQFVVFIPECTD